MTITHAIIPARFKAGGMPNIQSMKYKTSESIIKGSIVLLDSNGELILATDDTNNPADNGIKGVAMEDAGSKPGYSVGHSGSDTVYTGRVQEVSVALADTSTEFLGQISADGSAVTTPTQTLIGEQYRLAKASNSIWYVNSADTTPANVSIVDIDADRNLVVFKFTEVSIQVN